MSKLHASINFSFRKKELQKNEVELLDLNARPVESDFSNLQVSDSDSVRNPQQNSIDDDEIIGDEYDIISSERWERELAEWESMLKEERSMLKEEALRNDPGSLEGDILKEYKHLASYLQSNVST
jgi:hypothetical protein